MQTLTVPTTPLAATLALAPEQLRRRCDPAALPFATTAELAPLAETIGQPRALGAFAFGLEMTAPGYNLFVAGQPGSGRETTALDELRRFAATRPAPPDWVYVYSFTDADRPNAIRLPAGQGAGFAREMAQLVATLRRELPRAFESEEYERRQRALIGEITARRNGLLEDLTRAAREQSFGIEMTPAGVMSVPMINGQPIPSEAYQLLAEEQRRDIERRGEVVRELVATTMRQVRLLEKEAAERMIAVDREVALFVAGPLLDDLREGYAGEAEVERYLDQVRDDLLAHYRELREVADGDPEPASLPAGLAGLTGVTRSEYLARYAVNVLIDHDGIPGAPVVVERNPTYYNLIGRMDYHAALGAMVTDFRQIKPGALHRANGGFLVLHAEEVLRQPFAWDALKRALLCHEIRIENLGEQYSAVPAATLRPEPVPLDVKVVLIGSPAIFQLLHALDEDFQELFKVKADFAPDMPWSDDAAGAYAAFVARQVRDAGLRHFDRAAVARVIEQGARLREHQRKLSTRMSAIADLVTEASFWASKAGHDIVQADDVSRAIAAKETRSSLLEERVRELIAEGTLEIATDGERVGQVNGIAVLDAGDAPFGKPSRISARVALGDEVRSIEREIKLSGPIHSKGFLILSGYLAGQYGQQQPLALGATIAFEQAYDEVDGDSASSTELYALLSAIGELPLRQGIAVTGAVDQYGHVQAVGGVNEKIEGFYAVCAAQGLTGEQGVILPASNVPHLMLDEEVVDAVEAGRFHVWAVRSVDEGIELLTGLPAGTRDADGHYPEGSVHRLVAERLRADAERAKAFAAK